jgi:hypothetical protein
VQQVLMVQVQVQTAGGLECEHVLAALQNVPRNLRDYSNHML